MKKITSILLATVMGAAILLPVGCGEKKGCQHDVGTWEEVTPATCEREGSEKGTCGICYEEQTRVIPVDPEGHIYGEWQITKPTQEEIGEAEKVCTENGEHKLSVPLPKLSDVRYRSSITTRPTPAKNGVRTYVLNHDEGDIIFEEPVLATGIQSVMDAVDLGVAEESRALVRKSEGQMTTKYVEPGTNRGESVYDFSYEFGEDYTYIVDGGDNGTQRWYFKDENEEINGLKLDKGKYVNDMEADATQKKNYIKGARFYLQYANDLGYFYGAESLLEGMYRAARWSANNDFVESSSKNEQGKMEYSFSFGSIQNSGGNSGYFAVITTTFTLTDTYVIETCKVVANVYVNNSAQTDGSVIKTWDVDENGFAYVIESQKETGAHYVSTIVLSQTEKQEGDVLIQNPHTPDKMYIQDFDVTYRGEVMKEGDKAEFASGEFTDYIFQITNVTPQSALEEYSFESFSFYLRTKDESGEVVDLPINSGTMVDVGMTMFMDPQTKKFFLNAKQAGEQTVVIKTAMTEKIIPCLISEDTPSALYPRVYEYVNGAYMWDEIESSSTSKTIFIHQPLYFTAAVPQAETNYASSRHTVKVSPIEDTDYDKDGKDKRLMATAVGGVPATQFTADKTGTYTITLTSALDTSKTATITVTVVEAPAFEELAKKTYTQDLTSVEMLTVDVVFSDLQSGENEDGKAIITMKAKVTVQGKGEEILSCTYVLESRELTTEHESGVEYNFKIGFNEAYDFVLSRFYPEFNEEEIVVLREKK